MKKTYVIAVFPYLGVQHICKNQDEYNLIMLNNPHSNYTLKERFYTEEELETHRKLFKRRMLVTCEDYINDIKNHTHLLPNKNHCEDFINSIKENIGKVDVIFTGVKKFDIEILESNNIEYTLVLPTVDLKETIIGRGYICSNKKSYDLYSLNSLLDTYDEEIEKLLSSKSFKYYIDNLNIYLSDVINDILKLAKPAN